MIQVIAGPGKGKSSAALGHAVKAASSGRKVIVIQFLKEIEDNDFVKKMEPEIRILRFEKTDRDFNALSEQEKKWK